jgi:hypothetical protein
MWSSHMTIYLRVWPGRDCPLCLWLLRRIARPIVPFSRNVLGIGLLKEYNSSPIRLDCASEMKVHGLGFQSPFYGTHLSVFRFGWQKVRRFHKKTIQIISTVVISVIQYRGSFDCWTHAPTAMNNQDRSQNMHTLPWNVEIRLAMIFDWLFCFSTMEATAKRERSKWRDWSQSTISRFMSSVLLPTVVSFADCFSLSRWSTWFERNREEDRLWE